MHAADDRLDPGLYPQAFCKIVADNLTGDAAKCVVTHSDGSGTKALLAYLWWKETGDASVFRGIAQDSIVMNIDDLLCVGVTKGVILSSTINRNAKAIPGAILAELINGTEDVLAMLRAQGFGITSGGGETADVGDLTIQGVQQRAQRGVPGRDVEGQRPPRHREGQQTGISGAEALRRR